MNPQLSPAHGRREGDHAAADIAAAATRALEWDAAVPLQRIQVDIARGWIPLQDEVDWQFLKTDAERVVHRLSGVCGVTNLIRVRPRLTPTPGDLKRRIEDALVRSAHTDAERIRVEVDSSKVTLGGSVRTYAEKIEAERTAWSAPGVTSVDNQIAISLSAS